MSFSPRNPARLLRSAWIGNALFSSFCALAFLVWSSGIGEFCGAPAADIFSTGVGLVVFVGLLAVLITRPDPRRRWVLALAALVAGLDILWVVATPAGLAGHTTGGKWMLSGIALVVAVFAVMQVVGLVGLIRRPGEQLAARR